MLASTMKESMSMPAEPAQRSRAGTYSWAESAQLPDLSKLNSVPGLFSLETIAGSTSPEGPSTERPLQGAGSFVDDSTSEQHHRPPPEW